MNRIEPEGRGCRRAPRCRSAIRAFTSRSVNSHGPCRLVTSTWPSSLGPTSSTPCRVVTPTLLTTSSIGPSTASSSASSMMPSWPTSPGRSRQGSAEKERASAWSSLSTTTTSAPAMISHLAIASPIPRAAPVTTARRPRRSSGSAKGVGPASAGARPRSLWPFNSTGFPCVWPYTNRPPVVPAAAGPCQDNRRV